MNNNSKNKENNSKSNKLRFYVKWKTWRPNLSYAEQAVLYDIIDNIIVDNNESTFVSQQTIAGNLGKKRENIARIISSLISKKIVYKTKIKTKKWNKNCYKINWNWKPETVENLEFTNAISEESVVSINGISCINSSLSVVSNSHTNNLLNNLNNNKKVIKKKTDTQKIENLKKELIEIFNEKFNKNIRTFGSDTNLKKALKNYSHEELKKVVQKYALEYSNNIDELSFQKYLNFRNIFKPEVIQRIIEVEERKQNKPKNSKVLESGYDPLGLEA